MTSAVVLMVAACGGHPNLNERTSDANGRGGTSPIDPRGAGGASVIIGQGGDPNMAGTGNTQPSVCGNSALEPGELCDDGNVVDGDGCSGDCSVVTVGYFCAPGQPCMRLQTCGNGVIEGDEACDDANVVGGDGCASDCSVIESPIYACVKPGQPCVLKPICGNGQHEKGEQCDDANVLSGDGCSALCQLESGFFCAPGKACVALACGDGKRTPDERCDDANKIAGDGCSPTCTVEPGWLCSSTGCRPVCGDGKVLGSEECDDGDVASGDGCSAACKIEPFYKCVGTQPSVCTSTVVCGDGVLSPGEVCDPGIPGESACYGPTSGPANACRGYNTGLVSPPVCNNGVVEYKEACDGAVVGCTNCAVDPGYVCPTAGVCFKMPVCGDGLLQGGEQCDLGLVSGVGCVACQIQPNYFCSGEPSVCVASICGDGTRAPNEGCDDHNTDPGDGCSPTCSLEPGWSCPPKSGCQAICGDGVRTGTEQCDTPDASACTNCRLNPGYSCGVNGTDSTCTQTRCGNGTPPSDPSGSAAYIAKARANAEPGEGCDDGNQVAGDGCGPTCQLEPQVTVGPNPVVALTCGDGLVAGGEGCDDGNVTSGDGCSSTCQVESGWKCSGQVTYPDSVAFKVTYRDFKQRNVTPGGHPHMMLNGPGAGTTPDTSPAQGRDPGIVGTVCTAATNQSNTCGRLDAEGKPAYVGGAANTHPTIDTDGDGANLDEAYHKAAFSLWYRDTNAAGTLDPTSQVTLAGSPIEISVNPAPVPPGGDTLTLAKLSATGQPATKGPYQFQSTSFFVLDNRGFGNTAGQNHNFQFTSELRYFFQYQGGETLNFYGDDDVWVFINGRLAVDIGGIHGQLNGRVVLGDDGDGGTTESNCSISVADNSTAGTLPTCTLEANEDNGDDKRFSIIKGNVYEIIVFQAERHPTGSNYRLTLDGFIAPRSFCQTDCGDGIRAGRELCDEGRSMPASGYGVCLNTCEIQFCGDGVTNGNEQCDNRVNSSLYGTSGCAPGCVFPSRCGDGILQVGFGEECDKGPANANGVYGGCTTTCKLGPYCGDGVVSNGEACDTPGKFTTYATGPGQCNYNCQTAPFCGDGIRNGAEVCDGTPNCTPNCEFAPFCGDGIKETGEQCDYGQFGFNGPPEQAPYGGCTTLCKYGPFCGDGTLQAASGEECDNGPLNADNVYDGCTLSCLLGPRCGDGIVAVAAGEACDNGFNQDIYAYPGETNACGPRCTPVPFCGNGIVESAFELCDKGTLNSNTSYNGCTTTCEFGPYCGDGVKNGPEECDDGAKNTVYAADGNGCSYECTRNVPYCGDGIRNGSEQCDLGTALNTGAYGGCNKDCTKAPFCGNYVVDKNSAEQCDDGPSGSFNCSSDCRVRVDILR